MRDIPGIQSQSTTGGFDSNWLALNGMGAVLI